VGWPIAPRDDGRVRCEECGFVYEDVPATEIAGLLRAAAPQYRSRVEPLLGDPGSLLRRPAPDVWSVHEQLSRGCVYNYPTRVERDVLWMGRHTVHECVHHLLDIDRGLH
jgi:hypothetical protein